jgi:hypothetical protein
LGEYLWEGTGSWEFGGLCGERWLGFMDRRENVKLIVCENSNKISLKRDYGKLV